MKDWHYEQSWTNSCIPACMCIVQKWRGDIPTEALHHEDPSVRGHPYRRACRLDAAVYGALSSEEEDGLIPHIVEGGIVLIGVFNREYSAWQRGAYPDLRSKHGVLWTPGKYGGPRESHAVVLVRWDDASGFWLLDPWFPSDGQPLLMKKSDFTTCFNGNAVFMNPMPR